MKYLSLLFFIGLLAFSCQEPATQAEPDGAATDTVTEDDDFVWSPEKFADIRMIRYQVPGFEKLTLQQKKLVYYLSQAGLAGRDIMYDMNYRYNLAIRHALDTIVKNYKGDKNSEEWKNFMVYVKRVWFSSGIHHHYSNDKFIPTFSKSYFKSLLQESGASLSETVIDVLFNPEVDAKKVNRNPEKDLVKGSAVNFYDPDITNAEVDAFYEKMIDKNDPEPISYGLNSKLVRTTDGSLKEEVWKADGMYGEAIREIIKWLEKAVTVAENQAQGDALKLLIEYYKTGDLEVWDQYNIAWVQATEGDIDYINSFIEVYQDPKGYKGSYESLVEINDFDASERMAVVAKNAQYFEDNSTIMDAHKKEKVQGISYKVVNVATGSGDVSPSSPIGVNLPNANWIRAKHGSKSVSLGNITEAYSNSSGPGLTAEFAHDEEEIARSKKYGKLAGKIHTALHEVIGHASGKLEEGTGTPKETLKNYASALEEARADLVSLYFIIDPKLQEMGIVPDIEVAKAEYDSYIRNGLMMQLRRIEPGKDIEQSHMRNRAMVSHWVYEKGKADNIIAKVERDGHTYFDITDYEKLRSLFGELLREVQRVKSQGDYNGGRDLIERYGVKVDPAIHQEVLARAKKLDIPPYGGFINPKLEPVTNDAGEITDVKISYPEDFTQQMLEYADIYSYLKTFEKE